MNGVKRVLTGAAIGLVLIAAVTLVQTITTVLAHYAGETAKAVATPPVWLGSMASGAIAGLLVPVMRRIIPTLLAGFVIAMPVMFSLFAARGLMTSAAIHPWLIASFVSAPVFGLLTRSTAAQLSHLRARWWHNQP